MANGMLIWRLRSRSISRGGVILFLRLDYFRKRDASATLGMTFFFPLTPP